ncbi:MAG: HAMP domain-containing protein [Deltaproteobacteria bacterium]|nr:HAMP domain-containing protein [Deltaproteobacteria bacterium]
MAWRVLIPPSLRFRLIAALLLAVALAVTAETISHMAEVSSRLERDLAAHGDRVSDALRTELEQTLDTLDFELEAATGPVARTLLGGRIEARFLGTKARLQEGVLEVLKVLGPDGAILSSGHWPASFGALDPNFEGYRPEKGQSLHVVDEPTPEGSSPAIERWATGRAGAREVTVVAGRFLDAPQLERMRGRTGADVLALCRVDEAEAAESSRTAAARACVSVGAPGLLGQPGFDPDDPAIDDRFHLVAIDLGTHHLWVGLDRSTIVKVRTGILQRAVFVGLASIAFAMLLGTLIATRLTRPIEQLAQGAAKLASGDLSARIPVDARRGNSEVDRLVDAFNSMAADLERGQGRLLQAERVAAWQEIARGLAHELKNPLTPILGAMDVVRKARKLDRPDFDAILEEQATAVVEEVMRLKELSDAFARFARLPEKKVEPLRMSELVDHAVALYANTEGLTVERVYEEGLPAVDADRTQLGIVVTNLIKNAVEAMDGKGTLRLFLRRVGDPPSTLELAVDDSGPGIAAEVRERLFTPYVTTKGSRGTGLGLALAHRIVHDHEGVIEAGDAPGGGARFTVRLPLAAARGAGS